MKKRNYFVALVCGLVSMLMLSSCGAMRDLLYDPYLLPPPYYYHHHHCPPPPPPCHHHHHYRYIVNVDGDATHDMDMALTDIPTETSVL